ncbi:MAG: glycosyltransferase [Polyangiaceae bacterium]|nr:glycosyltransferase [Polyangiaceae bacterium]
MASRRFSARWQKLSFFLPALSDGGAERVWVTFASGLAARGANVELVVSGPESKYVEELHASVALVRLPAARLSLLPLKLAAHYRSTRPDVILTTMVTANLVAGAAAQLGSPRSKLIMREAASPRAPSFSWREALTPVARQLSYPMADAIIAPCQEVAKQLTEVLPLKSAAKIHVIPNPIAVDTIIQMSTEAGPWPFPQHTPVIVACGRLDPTKGFDILLRALAMVLKKRPVHLAILGEGSERAALIRLSEELGIAQNVSLLGFVKNPFHYFARAQVFVLSSRSEGFPNVLLQAMACGSQVVAADCPTGPREIILDPTHGLLVPPENVYALSEAVLQQLAAPPRNPAAVARSRDFDVHLGVDAMERLLQNLR